MGISSGIGAVGYIPTGAVMPFAGSTAPTNWLLCFGQAVSRTSYGALFATIGTTYGTGDGSTTFNLPDLRGRGVSGLDNMGGTAASRLTAAGSGITGTTLGASGGTETHTLTTAQLASHNHTQDAHNHSQNSHGHTNSVSNPSHTHQVKYNVPGYAGGGNFLAAVGGGSTGFFTDAGTQSTSVTVDANTATNIAATATNQAAGGGNAHQNTQPTIVLTYIIKT